MLMPLTIAAFNKPLVIETMADPELAMRLKRMGLFEGSKITRLDREVLVRPVRVRSSKGELSLGGGMSMKIVVHLDDGEKRPLVELEPGQSGHIEGLTGGRELAETLRKLNLKPDERITFIRILPPMEYMAINAAGDRIRLTEGMAVKILGRVQGHSRQFVSAGVGVEFHVEDILGGKGARNALQHLGVDPGKMLILESVAQAQSLKTGVRNPIVIVSTEGLRLFLTRYDGDRILVRESQGVPGNRPKSES